jgi:hypothetical protein
MTGRGLILVLALAAFGCGDDPVEDDDSTIPGDDDTMAGDDDDTTPGPDDDDSAVGDDDDHVEPPLAQIAIPCTDLHDDVYFRPAGLPAWDETVLGDVVRCATLETLAVLEVADVLEGVGIEDLDPWAGAHTFAVAYRTTRWEGQEGLATARVYLPDTLVQGGPRPVIVIHQGPHGVADSCAPSKTDLSTTDSLALGFVGRGYAVVAPDLAGLGGDGLPGYGQTADTARSILDAARAAVDAVLYGSVTDDVVVVGLDEGGAAALGAQALAADYLGQPLLGAVTVAPDWRVDEDDLIEAFTAPESTYFTGDASTRLALRMLTDGGNFHPPYGETAYFEPFVAEAVATHIWTECYDQLLGTVQFEAIYYSELLEESFATTAAACLTGIGTCAPPGQGFVERIQADRVSMDPGGGPILVLQGLLDAEITPEHTACVVEHIAASGVTYQACTEALAGHDDTLWVAAPFIVQWTEAAVAGDPLPACAASELPVCS